MSRACDDILLNVTTVDRLDARILLALDDDADATTLGLARTLGIARNTVQARLARLAAGGALRSFSHRVDPAALGYHLTAFVSLSISQAEGERAVAGLQALPEVVEMHAITGEADLLVRVLARDPQDLYRVTNAMLAADGVQRASTAISLHEEMPTRLRPLLAVRAE